jgi:Mg-chelatase subunit ChlD
VSAAAACVVALVHLADASGSVTADEWTAMQRGSAAAFASPEVVRAVERGGPVAVTALAFGDRTAVLVGWRVLTGAADADAFAAALEAAPRPGHVGGSTATGTAINAALRALERAPCEAERSVIDIVTDGDSNAGDPVEPAREAAVALGVQINGLAVAHRGDPEEWLRAHVMTPGGFVFRTDSPEDFARVFRSKLVRELAAR